MTKARDLAAILSDGSILADGVVGLGEVTGGTNNGVVYVDGTGTTTNGSALVFDGTNLGVGTSAPATKLQVSNTAGYSTVTVTGNSASGGILSFVDSAGVTTQRILGFGSTAGENTSLRFDTNGSEKMRLDSAGNLGLGVTPSAWNSAYKTLDFSWASLSSENLNQGGMRLNVNAYADSSGYNNWYRKNNAAATSYKQNDGVHSWYTAAYGTAGAAISFTQAMTLDASGGLQLGVTSSDAKLYVTNGASPASRLIVGGGGGAANTLYTVLSGGNNIQFETNGAERARIDSSGNFNLNGTAGFNVLGFEPATTIGSSGVNYITGINTTNIGFKISTTEVMRINTSGNLLVGTNSSIGTASVGKVQILGGETFITTNNEVAGFVGVNSNADNSVAIVADPDSLRSGSHIAFYVDGFSEKARIDSSGNLLVGGTTAYGKVTVHGGKTIINSDASNYGQFQIGNGNAEASIAFISGVTNFGDDPTSTNGNNYVWAIGAGVYGIGGNSWGIGNKGASTYVAKIAYNSTSWTFSSDERLKNLDGQIENAVVKVASLRPVYYTWKNDSSKKRKVGLIAQDVLAVLPEAVEVPEQETRPDGQLNYLGLGMSDVVPLLVAAIQEQQAIIESLKADVAELKGKL